jgi:Helicase conserved C-terminal domain
MKFTAENLRAFFELLPVYEALPIPARQEVASIRNPSETGSKYDYHRHFEALVEAGFLQPAVAPDRWKVPPERQTFVRLVRVLHDRWVFRWPSEDSFSEYIADHLTPAEKKAFFVDELPAGERNSALFREITSPDYLESFLSAKGMEWGPAQRDTEEPLAFANPEILRLAQRLCRKSIEAGQPAPMRDLPAWEPDSALLTAVLAACIRYALLFVSLDRDTADPVIGPWPTTAAYIAASAAPAPRKTEPAEIFSPMFLMEDATALLIACAASPPALRGNDNELFAKTVREMEAHIRPLPDWLASAFEFNTENRLRTVSSYVRTFGLAVEKGTNPARLTVTELGRKWLALAAGDRLRVLTDGILDRRQSIELFKHFEGAQVGAVAPQVYARTTVNPLPDFDAATTRPFRELEGDSFYPLKEILAHCRPETNPLLEIFRRDKLAYFWAGSLYETQADAASLHKAWVQVVSEYLRIRLLPMGAVRLGKGKKGISIAITPVGRYLLGQTQQWQSPGDTVPQVIAQPNFDVTFLGESPAAEAEIAQFAERRSRGLGALFQITRKSIFAAAAAGLTAETVLDVLDRVCTQAAPANVRREIQGWFAQCRRVTFESAILIRCPDRETALKVLGLAKGAATPLNETVLAYKDPGKQRPALIKRLKDMGVLVLQDDQKTTPAPYLGRRGRW